MQNQFEPSDSTLKFAAEKLKIQNAEVAIRLGKNYSDLVKSIPYQYMAHTIRTMEKFVRQKMGSPKFCIICEPMLSPNDVVADLATARYKKGSFYIIVYDDRLKDDQKRAVIAHELGHLYIAVAGERDFFDKHEPLSSLFGTLVILHKNSPFKTPSEEFALIGKCAATMEKLKK